MFFKAVSFIFFLVFIGCFLEVKTSDDKQLLLSPTPKDEVLRHLIQENHQVRQEVAYLSKTIQSQSLKLDAASNSQIKKHLDAIVSLQAFQSEDNATARKSISENIKYEEDIKAHLLFLKRILQQILEQHQSASQTPKQDLHSTQQQHHVFKQPKSESSLHQSLQHNNSPQQSGQSQSSPGPSHGNDELAKIFNDLRQENNHLLSLWQKNPIANKVDDIPVPAIKNVLLPHLMKAKTSYENLIKNEDKVDLKTKIFLHTTLKNDLINAFLQLDEAKKQIEKYKSQTAAQVNHISQAGLNSQQSPQQYNTQQQQSGQQQLSPGTSQGNSGTNLRKCRLVNTKGHCILM